MNTYRHSLTVVFWLGVASVTGCAFDISRVKELPVEYTPVSDVSRTFVLKQDVGIGIGTGYQTHLRSGTRWRQTGRTPHGDVFATRDQLVKVEASNIHEAQVVIQGQRITGFYLPVEKTFVAVKQPIPVTIEE
jgi:hypothetical protein